MKTKQVIKPSKMPEKSLVDCTEIQQQASPDSGFAKRK